MILGAFRVYDVQVEVEVRGYGLGARGWELEVRGKGLEVRCWELGVKSKELGVTI